MLGLVRKTPISEDGRNLSGGQRQRIELARAWYAQKTAVFLDDPFSALDPSVRNLIANRLLFSEWPSILRIVVMSEPIQLEKFDRILFVKAPGVYVLGRFQELLLLDREFRDIYSNAISTSENILPQISGNLCVQKTIKSAGDPVTKHQPHLVIPPAIARERISSRFLWANLSIFGITKWRLLALILPTVALCLALVQQQQLLQVLAQDQSTQAVLVVWGLAASSLAAVIFGIWQKLSWLWVGVGAGKTIFTRMAKGLLKTSLDFHTGKSSGQILNSMVGDVEIIEREIPNALEDMLRSLALVLAAIWLACKTWPALIVIVLACVPAYYRLQRAYRQAGTQIKVIMRAVQAPHLTEFRSLSHAADQIAWCQSQEYFADRYDSALDRKQKGYHVNILINRWFSIRVPLYMSFYLASLLMTIIWLSASGRLSAAHAGMLITGSLGIWESLHWFIRCFCESETRLVSLSRALEFIELPPEPNPMDGKGFQPLGHRIEFAGVTAGYGIGRTAVLQDMNLKIEAGEHVAIIGRTGSGKSTFLKVLLRFIPLSSGRIAIGGVDIGAMSLDQLRKLAILVPQETFLCARDLRECLDPHGQHKDPHLLSLLQRLEFPRLASCPLDIATLQLSAPNLNASARQIVSIARAILQKPAILALDEPSASLDGQAEEALMRVLQTDLPGTTILVVSHREALVSVFKRVIRIDPITVLAETYQR